MRFGYDGLGFAGWARQPGLRTVEGEIRRGLIRLGIAGDPGAAGLSVASRTDRGVSARGNALAIDSEIPPAALLRALNGLSAEIWFTHLVRVPDDFRPRAAVQRWYRYWERETATVPAAWRAAARCLEGRIDVRSFGRGLPPDRPTWRTVDSVEARIDAGWLVAEVRAPSFVWGMVRKFISALRAVEEGALQLRDLEEAAKGERRLALPLAESDRLVLWETSYSLDWELEREGVTIGQERYARDALQRSAARRRILLGIADGAGRPGTPS